MGIRGASGFWGRGPKMRAARRLSADAKPQYWLESAEVKGEGTLHVRQSIIYAIDSSFRSSC